MAAVVGIAAAAADTDCNCRPDMNPDSAIMAADMYLCLQEMKLAEEHIHNHMKPRLRMASNDYKDRS